MFRSASVEDHVFCDLTTAFKCVGWIDVYRRCGTVSFAKLGIFVSVGEMGRVSTAALLVCITIIL